MNITNIILLLQTFIGFLHFDILKHAIQEKILLLLFTTILLLPIELAYCIVNDFWKVDELLPIIINIIVISGLLIMWRGEHKFRMILMFDILCLAQCVILTFVNHLGQQQNMLIYSLIISCQCIPICKLLCYTIAIVSTLTSTMNIFNTITSLIIVTSILIWQFIKVDAFISQPTLNPKLLVQNLFNAELITLLTSKQHFGFYVTPQQDQNIATQVRESHLYQGVLEMANQSILNNLQVTVTFDNQMSSQSGLQRLDPKLQSKVKFNSFPEFLQAQQKDYQLMHEHSRIYAKDKENGIKYRLIVQHFYYDDIHFTLIHYLNVVLLQNQQESFKEIKKFKQSLSGCLTHKLKTNLSTVLIHLTAANNDAAVSQNLKLTYIVPSLQNCQLQLYQVQDIVDYIQSDFENLQLTVSQVNVVNLTKEAMSLIKTPCDAKQIELKLLIKVHENIEFNEEQQFSFMTDPNKLSRIIINLLNNSYRHTQIGGIITITITCNNKTCTINIEDTGQGIPDNQMELINRELRTVDVRKCSDSINFNGISLNIVNRLVRVLNGKQQSLQIIKTSNQGTQIEFIIDNIQEQTSALFLRSQQNIDYYKSKRNSLNNQQPLSGLTRKHAVSNFSTYKLIQQDESEDSFESINTEPPSKGVIPTVITKSKSINMRQQAISINMKTPTTPLRKYFQSKNSMYHADSQQMIMSHQLSGLDIQLQASISNHGIYLIADDEPFNHVSLNMMLKCISYNKIMSAYNGQECLEMVHRHKGEIRGIFMDVDMPILDGVTATSIIVNKQQANQLDFFPIIGCTAHEDQKTQDICLNAGMMVILTKPVFLKQLQEIVRMIEEPASFQQLRGNNYSGKNL